MRDVRQQEWLDALVVAAIALAVNLIYLSCSAGDYFFPDSFTYLTPARNLLAGLGFTSRGMAETIRTPGYPLLLAAMGARILPVILLQHFLNVAMAAATLLGARRIGLSRLGAFAAGLFVALDAVSIHYANKILSETSFTALLLAVILALLAWRRESMRAPGSSWVAWALAIGFATGALVLIRPVAIAAFVVFAIWMACVGLPRRGILLFILAALLLPFGWGLRNRERTGVFTVSSISGTNLLMFRAAGAIAMEERSGDFRADLARVQKELLADAEGEIEESLGIPDAEELPHAVLSGHFSRIAVETIREHPKGFLLVTLRGLAVNLFESRWEAIGMVSRLRATAVRFALGFWTIAMFLLTLAGAFALWRSGRRSEAMLLLLTIGYFIAISAGGESEARFRVPVIPEAAIAAGAGLELLVRLAKGRSAVESTLRP